MYFLHPNGDMGEFKPGAGPFSYRMFTAPAGAILVGARLCLHRRSCREIQKDIKHRLKQKKAAMPLGLAAAGPIWKNPSDGTTESLIAAVKLKGKELGGAEIFPKHANFIVNRGAANSADIKALMDMTRSRVRDQFGITLEPMIRTIGDI